MYCCPIVCGGSGFGPCLVIQYFMPFYLCNHLNGEEKAGCFTLIVFLMSCDGECYVALPHVAMGWSAVFDCGISSMLFWCVEENHGSRLPSQRSEVEDCPI